jgi:hypothetical protein
MFKTFITGILLGIVTAAAALYYVPVVDQSRERSLIVVHPNHGNTESFHANLPSDRIMIGAKGLIDPLPVGLEWPEDEQFTNVRAELFKLRNGKDAVVGVASRLSYSDGGSGDIVEWVLHLPARGSVYVVMRAQAREGGGRIGEFRAGTREFENMTGLASERWTADTSGGIDAPVGRVELITALVAQQVELE